MPHTKVKNLNIKRFFFFKSGFHSVYYMGTMLRFVTVKPCFFCIIHCTYIQIYSFIVFNQNIIYLFWYMYMYIIQSRYSWVLQDGLHRSLSAECSLPLQSYTCRQPVSDSIININIDNCRECYTLESCLTVSYHFWCPLLRDFFKTRFSRCMLYYL